MIDAFSWQDIEVSLGNVESATYTLNKKGGLVFYTGKAYRRPDARTLVVNLRDILSENLDKSFPEIMGTAGVSDDGSDPIFEVKTLDEFGSPTLVEEVRVFYDWSYTPVTPNPSTLLARPITGEVAPNQILLCSYRGTSAGTEATLLFPTGDEVSVPFATTPELGTMFLDLGQYPEVEKVTIDFATTPTITYNVVENCPKYALYYLNDVGGWDSLLVNGSTIQTDEYERSMYEQPYETARPESRGETNYLTKIKRMLEVNTGWLLGDAGKKMYQLLGSPQVFLCELGRPQFLAVNIDTRSCEYKDYKTNGGKLVDWKLKLSLTQNRWRK